jgi:hypothetical protein
VKGILFNKKEIWKDIDGYEGFYQVSNLGRVKSLERKVPLKNGKLRTYRERIKSQEEEKGYMRVNLYKNGKLKKFLVHRLVATAFHGPNDESMEVNHINGDTKDNRAENLEWVTTKENAHHKSTVLNRKPRGVYRTGISTWRAEIVFNQKHKVIGIFDNKSDAYRAFYNEYLKLRGVPPWDLNKYKTH